MKRTLQRLVLAVALVTTASSCTTAYDAYGRPYDVVDPGTAVVGAAAVGLLAYGLANSNDHNHHRRSYRSNHYSHGGYHGSHNHGYSSHSRGYSGYGHGYSRGYRHY